VTGAILAVFVLGQRLSAAGIAGAVTLVAAVLVTVRDATPQTPQPGP
jgi:drug/metabolite transporter (DMT)-like permease